MIKIFLVLFLIAGTGCAQCYNTFSYTPTKTYTPTNTITLTLTRTFTNTFTSTNTLPAGTNTFTPKATHTFTNTRTSTNTPDQTLSATPTMTSTNSYTSTRTPMTFKVGTGGDFGNFATMTVTATVVCGDTVTIVSNVQDTIPTKCMPGIVTFTGPTGVLYGGVTLLNNYSGAGNQPVMQINGDNGVIKAGYKTNFLNLSFYQNSGDSSFVSHDILYILPTANRDLFFNNVYFGTTTPGYLLYVGAKLTNSNQVIIQNFCGDRSHGQSGDNSFSFVDATANVADSFYIMNGFLVNDVDNTGLYVQSTQGVTVGHVWNVDFVNNGTGVLPGGSNILSASPLDVQNSIFAGAITDLSGPITGYLGGFQYCTFQTNPGAGLGIGCKAGINATQVFGMDPGVTNYSTSCNFNPIDYMPSSSGVLYAGASVGSIMTDVFGMPYHSPPTIGEIEYNAAWIPSYGGGR